MDKRRKKTTKKGCRGYEKKVNRKIMRIILKGTERRQERLLQRTYKKLA